MDVFLFGVVLLEMLTQRMPFARDPEALGWRQLRLSAARPPAPSQMVPGVPPKLDEVARHCLAEPGERYPDVTTLLQALAA